MNCLHRRSVSHSDTSFSKLKVDEGKYRGLFENAIEGIYQSTPDGHYLIVNAALARMYGYDNPDELLNQVSNIQNQIYVDSGFREKFKLEMERKGFVEGLEYQVRRRDGTVIWISESARAVRDESGAIRHYEGFIDNITARKNAEAERARLEKEMLHSQKMDAIGALAGGIAHDFNNILCAILGYTELALQDSHVKSLTRENLQMVLRSAERARELIKRILTFSRPTDSQRYPLKLSSVLKEVVKMLQATLPSSVAIETRIRTEEDVVVADATELHQVVMNLGTNAGHAMKNKGGRLEFELDTMEIDSELSFGMGVPAGEYVHLVVRDTGKGMSHDVLERIFEPFFTTKGPGRGTGLGLTLVQKIITRNGGSIKVSSELGHGTTFHIYLPRSKELPATISTGQNQIVRGHREQILVVDDEIPVLDMMQQHLRKMGYRVTTRADSREAIKTFRANSGNFDLVITDHTMPEMQGDELAEEIGAVRPDLPVILMTGLNQPPDLSSSRFARRRLVFQKPVNFARLSHCLREFLDHPDKATEENAAANGNGRANGQTPVILKEPLLP